MNGRLARAIWEEGVLDFVRLIQRALRLANDPAQYPQTFVGGDWSDRFRRAPRGPSLTTTSMGGKSTETQHRKAVEAPTSVLERWLRNVGPTLEQSRALQGRRSQSRIEREMGRLRGDDAHPNAG